MEALKAFLREYHYLVSGALGGLGTMVIMNWVYKTTMAAPVEVDGENNEVFRHAGRGGKFMAGLGLVCLLFAALPAYALIYPREYFPKLALMIGFGFAGIYCLLEARRAYVILKPRSLVISGAWSGPREVALADIASIKSHDSLQLLRFTDKNGQKYWASYMLSGFGKLIQRLNQRGIPVTGQMPAIAEMQKAVEEKTGETVTLAWFMLPFLSIFKTSTGHAILMLRFNDDGFDGYHIHQTRGGPRDAVQELIAQLQNFTATNDRGFAEAFSTDLNELLNDRRAWPAHTSTGT